MMGFPFYPLWGLSMDSKLILDIFFTIILLGLLAIAVAGYFIERRK